MTVGWLLVLSADRWVRAEILWVQTVVSRGPHPQLSARRSPTLCLLGHRGVLRQQVHPLTRQHRRSRAAALPMPRQAAPRLRQAALQQKPADNWVRATPRYPRGRRWHIQTARRRRRVALAQVPRFVTLGVLPLLSSTTPRMVPGHLRRSAAAEPLVACPPFVRDPCRSGTMTPVVMFALFLFGGASWGVPAPWKLARKTYPLRRRRLSVRGMGLRSRQVQCLQS
mmetsp:Transcript_82566/g.220720  ORF Transcript_82566/g.220720 Transcript_82566/m.220720 type:complete len:225 (+) Transcript_82566:869-1543(+)